MTVANVLQQLQSKEAVLLMYLADELPPQDRIEVERMFAADPALGRELERLRDAHDAFVRAMPGLDRASRLPVPQGVAVRRVVAAMRQWHAKRAARPAPVPEAPPLRFPWWAYPMAAAASVVIAFLVWWGNSDRHERPEQYAGRVGIVSDGIYPAPADMDLVLAWEMGEAFDEPEEVRSLVEPSDYNIFFLSIEDGDGGATPKGEPEGGADDDDIYL